MKKRLAILLVLALLTGMLAGCGEEAVSVGTEQGGQTPSSGAGQNAGNSQPQTGNDAAPVEADFSLTDADMFSKRDRETDYDTAKAVQIRLEGTTATASSNSVQINGSTVILREEATYLVSGSLTDGMLVVDAPDTAKLQIVLGGAQITSQTCAALYILEADKVFVTLTEGTENTLANGGSFEAIDENNIDGAVFSKQDLTLNGAGALTVTSPAGHGIVCKDDLVITGGSYTVNAASHGLDVNDSVRIADGVLSVDAGKDAIHCENEDDASKGFIYLSGGTVKGEAEGDGIAAGAYLQIVDGTVDLLVGGGSVNGDKAQSGGFGGFMGGGPGGFGGPGGGSYGDPGNYGGGGGRPGSNSGRPGSNSGKPGGSQASVTQTSAVQPGTTQTTATSMKGLKAANSMLISGGSITIDSADDAIHSNVSIFINGGTFTLASGDDGIHAEDTLTVTAGDISISKCYEGLEALHIDVRGGDIELTARDDGLNAAGGTDQSGTTGGRDGMFGGGRPGGFGGMGGNSNGTVKISGGVLYINSSGDGIDANGTLEISGGHTTVVGPTQGDTATLDYDKTGVITGGTFIGTGSTMMAQSFSDSAQGVVALRVGNKAAGTQILLKDAQGNVLFSRTPELDFAVVILSSPELVKGETYTVVIGTASDQVTAS